MKGRQAVRGRFLIKHLVTLQLIKGKAARRYVLERETVEMVAGKQASTVKAALEKAPQEECEFSLRAASKEEAKEAVKTAAGEERAASAMSASKKGASGNSR